MSGTSTRSLVVVTAGLSEPSSSRLLGDRLAAATERHLREAGLDPRLEVIELRAHAIDLANQMLTGFPSPLLQASLDAVVTADGVIAVSPIFSGSPLGSGNSTSFITCAICSTVTMIRPVMEATRKKMPSAASGPNTSAGNTR